MERDGRDYALQDVYESVIVYRQANIDDFIDEPPTLETGIDFNDDLHHKTEQYIIDSIDKEKDKIDKDKRSRDYKNSFEEYNYKKLSYEHKKVS